jgi:hypothetical protein
MDTDSRNSRDPNNELESFAGTGDVTRRDIGISMIYNTNDDITDGLVPRPPLSDGSGRNAAPN